MGQRMNLASVLKIFVGFFFFQTPGYSYVTVFLAKNRSSNADISVNLMEDQAQTQEIYPSVLSKNM